jgi:hypothetical protein
MARKVDEAANFIFVQLIEQEPAIYHKRHADYSWRDKIDYNRIQIQNMFAKTVQTTTTIWPVLCDTSQQLGYSSSSIIFS